MPTDVVLRAADLRDATAFAEHVIEQMRESGKEGMPIFAPGPPATREEVRDNTKLRWARKLSDPHWGRAWVMEKTDGQRIVGHIELRGGRIPAELHRTVLGMGILREYTAQGYGRQLMAMALGWARQQPQLAWVDLGVFSHNRPAIKLYERTGFVREFVRKDAFRVQAGASQGGTSSDGTSIDDILMTLRIR